MRITKGPLWSCRVLGASLEERTFGKSLKEMVLQASAWEKEVSLCKSYKKHAASSIPFCPMCILDHLELSFNSWANTVPSYSFVHSKLAARSVCRKSLPVLSHRAKADV